MDASSALKNHTKQLYFCVRRNNLFSLQLVQFIMAVIKKNQKKQNMVKEGPAAAL